MDTMAVELPDLTTHAPGPPAEETAEEKWVFKHKNLKQNQHANRVSKCESLDGMKLKKPAVIKNQKVPSRGHPRASRPARWRLSRIFAYE